MSDDLAVGVQLLKLRNRLGLSAHAMSELLYTSQQTYQNWERGSQPRADALARIERFTRSASAQLDLLTETEVDITGLVPMNLVSSALGVPHETLFHMYRDGDFEGYDLGVLGVWLHRELIDQIAGIVRWRQ